VLAPDFFCGGGVGAGLNWPGVLMRGS